MQAFFPHPSQIVMSLARCFKHKGMEDTEFYQFGMQEIPLLSDDPLAALLVLRERCKAANSGAELCKDTKGFKIPDPP